MFLVGVSTSPTVTGILLIVPPATTFVVGEVELMVGNVIVGKSLTGVTSTVTWLVTD